jgi:hypothetical protein
VPARRRFGDLELEVPLRQRDNKLKIKEAAEHRLELEDAAEHLQASTQAQDVHTRVLRIGACARETEEEDAWRHTRRGYLGRGGRT